MSHKLEQSRSTADTATAATAAIAFSSNLTAASALVAACLWHSGSQTCSVADGTNGAWTPIGSPQVGTGGMAGWSLQLFYKLNSAGGAAPTVTMTCSGNNDYRALAIHEYSGIDTSGALEASTDIGNVTISSSTFTSTTGVTTTNPYDLIFGACVVDNTVSDGSGGTTNPTTLRENSNFGGNGTGDNSVYSVGTYKLRFSASGSTDGIMAVVAFKSTPATNAIQIRQEFSILNSVLTAATSTTADSNAILEVDAATFRFPQPCYLEIVVKTSVSLTNTVSLRRSGTSTDDVTINVPLGTTGYTRLRSSSFFINQSTVQDYIIHIGSSASGSTSVIAAKLIFLRGDRSEGIRLVEFQTELGSEETKSNTSPAPLTNVKYWKYDSSQLSGRTLWFIEVCYKTSGANNIVVSLQEDDGNFANWTDISGANINRSSPTPEIYVPGHFTGPTSGHNLRFVFSTASGSYTVYAAKLAIVNYEGQTLYFPNVYALGGVNSLKIQGGTAGSGQTNQGSAQSFQVTVAANQITGVKFSVLKVGSPTDSLQVDLTSSLGGTSLATATVPVTGLWNYQYAEVDFVFSSPFTPSLNTDYYLQVTRTGARDTTNYCCLEEDLFDDSVGANYILSNAAWGSARTNQTSMVLKGNIYLSKCVGEYSFLNASDSGTGKQTVQQLWTSGDWAGVTNAYKYSHDASNAADSSKLVDIDNSDADVSNATVTGANQQIASTGLTMPTSGHQMDVNVTNSTGVIGASRIIVLTTLSQTIRRWLLKR